MQNTLVTIYNRSILSIATVLNTFFARIYLYPTRYFISLDPHVIYVVVKEVLINNIVLINLNPTKNLGHPNENPTFALNPSLPHTSDPNNGQNNRLKKTPNKLGPRNNHKK